MELSAQALLIKNQKKGLIIINFEKWFLLSIFITQFPKFVKWSLWSEFLKWIQYCEKTELQQRILKFEFKKSEFPKENVEDKFLIFENEFWSDFQKLDFKRWFSNVNFQK